jgi:hypothetical protein
MKTDETEHADTVAARNRRQCREVSSTVALREAWIDYLISRKRDLPFERAFSASRSSFSYITNSRYQIAGQIATLAQATDVDQLCESISHELAREWSWWIKETDPIKKIDPIQLLVKTGFSWRTRNELKQVSRLSRKLSACLESMDVITVLLVDSYLPNDILDKRNYGTQGRPLARLEEVIGTLTEASSQSLSYLSSKIPRRLGRPPCLQTGPGSFSEFTLRLLWHVRDAGGQLTLDKNAGNGTLTRALEMLRPHLPPNFIPNSLPLSTLHHVKQLDKKTTGQKVSGRAPIFSYFLSWLR